MSAQHLTLLAVFTDKALCQAPQRWYYNALPWQGHIQNITSFSNIEWGDMLSNFKTTCKYWLNCVVLTCYTNELCCYVIHSSILRSGGLYHVTTQFYYCNTLCYRDPKGLHDQTYIVLCVDYWMEMSTILHPYEIISEAYEDERFGTELPWSNITCYYF